MVTAPTTGWLHGFAAQVPPFSQVPLIIFKREKQIARQLEDKLLWVRHSPSKLIEYWDGIVISAASFPHKYWDKQVKQRVRSGRAVASDIGSAIIQYMESSSKEI